MSASSHDSDLQRHSPSDGEQGDSLYWLAKVDEDLPRAHFVPDRRRAATGLRTYKHVSFEFAADVVRVLKSAHPSRGVPDVVVCAGLVAMLLGKTLREDRALLGLAPSATTNAPLLPVT